MARISGVDLPREKRVEIGLTYIFGIGLKTSQEILAGTGVNPDTRVKDLTEQDAQCARPFLEIRADKQLRADANAESQRLFHRPITKLSEPDRLRIASLLWQNRRTFSRKQLARATRLSPTLLEAVFH